LENQFNVKLALITAHLDKKFEVMQTNYDNLEKLYVSNQVAQTVIHHTEQSSLGYYVNITAIVGVCIAVAIMLYMGHNDFMRVNHGESIFKYLENIIFDNKAKRIFDVNIEPTKHVIKIVTNQSFKILDISIKDPNTSKFIDGWAYLQEHPEFCNEIRRLATFFKEHPEFWNQLTSPLGPLFGQ